MNGKFKKIRDHLDSLCYYQTLVPECVPLVEKLLLDLNKTTENLQKYMQISQQALEERDFLESGAEPYKCDNAKLIRECNDLHQAFIHFKEQHEKIQRDLRNQISFLQAQVDNCNLEKKKLMSQIQQFEKEKRRKGSKLAVSKDSQLSVKEKQQNPKFEAPMALAQENVAELEKKLKDYEDKYLKLTEENAVLKNQIKTRDNRIESLQSLTEGGRSYDALSNDCCFKNIDSQMTILQDEVTNLKKEKNNIQQQLKDAVAKQHEAMRRALHLAEKNKQLEKEIKDVDEIALAVEAECNNTVKCHSEKLARLQGRINESLIMIQNLEKDNSKLKQVKLELSTDLDAIKLEKLHLQKQLELEQVDKKKLTDRINTFTIIENDLNVEIDRLSKLNSEQKRRILELESQTLMDNVNQYHPKNNGQRHESQEQYFTEPENMPNKQKSQDKSLSSKQTMGHKKSYKKSGSQKRSPTRTGSSTKWEKSANSLEQLQKCCCESGNCFKNLKDILDKEMEFRQDHTKQSMDDLKKEKDYYMKEYHRVLEQVRNVPDYEISQNGIGQLKQQLNEKENQLKLLEEEINRYKKEKSVASTSDMLNAGLNSSRSCTNIACRGRERELDVKTQELNHVEVENSGLKAKLQSINETIVFNDERMKKAFMEMEEHIRKLEDERINLVKTELTQRANLSQLEDEHRILKDQLKQTQNELNNQRANYNQLKILHEQSDRTILDCQAQTVRLEMELASYKSKVKDSSRDSFVQDKEISKLTSDIQTMKNQLTRIDREKDDLMNSLDEKTEKIASLEEELAGKNSLVSKLENELKELNRKLSKYANESSDQDQIVRSKQQELAILKQDYEHEKKLKEAALQENKRLQSDLSSVACDCRDARKELDICRRQVEDLKRQLQHYVAEVKRTEDMISQKELERTELLDQFRNLSQEANILESNNHTLETEANQSKIQLSVALDHTSELERKLQNQESVIKSYEKQISDLTTQMARLEIQLKQNAIEHDQCQNELKQMQDLCVKLDKEKDTLKNELYSKDDRRTQVQKISEKLATERDSLQKALEDERNSLEALEKLLKEARHDLTEQRLLNQDLQREIGRSKEIIGDLQEKLNSNHLKNKNKPEPFRQSSVMSTKTLTRADKHYAMTDLTELSQQNSPEYSVDLSKVETAPTQYNISKSRNNSDDTVIDLTKLDQSNMDCHERCDKVKCPLHQKMFFNANHLCQQCQERLAKLNNCRKMTSEEMDNKLDEVSIDSTVKTVEFALENKKNDAAKKFETSSNLQPKEYPNLSSRSITSTKTLRMDKEHELRSLTRGVINLQELRGEDYRNEAELNLPANNKNLTKTEKKLKRFSCSGIEEETSLPVSKSNLCFEHKCSKHELSKAQEVPYTKYDKDPLDDSKMSGNAASGSEPNAQFERKSNDKNRKTFTKNHFPDSHSAMANEVHAEFGQNADSSAVFRKIFSLDGVGLECQCCISGFKLAKNQ